jgi:biotin transport system substrate-specific component
MNFSTYADIPRAHIKKHELLYDAALVVAGSVLVAASAQVSIPLPFSPVPITGQTLAVLLIGAALGGRRGALAMTVYLVEGASGLPVFAAGKAGIAVLLGPTGGYIVGFIGAAFLTGLLAELGWDRRFWTTILAMLFGSLIIYVCGLPWLAGFVGTKRVLAAGLLPFIPGDILKVVAAALLLPAGWKMVGLADRSSHGNRG